MPDTPRRLPLPLVFILGLPLTVWCVVLVFFASNVSDGPTWLRRFWERYGTGPVLFTMILGALTATVLMYAFVHTPSRGSL